MKLTWNPWRKVFETVPTRKVTCTRCEGMKFLNLGRTCPRCGGTGFIYERAN